MHPHLSKRACLSIDTKAKLDVIMASGDKLPSIGRCTKTVLTIQGTLICVDFHILPLGGCDVVLRAQWLQTLGPILWDFQRMWMQFTYGDQPRTIVSNSPTLVTYSTFNSLTKLGKVVEPSYIIYSLITCGPHKTTPEGTTPDHMSSTFSFT